MVVTSDYPTKVGTRFWTGRRGGGGESGFTLWRVITGGAAGRVAPYYYGDSNAVIEEDPESRYPQDWMAGTVFLVLEGDDYTTQTALLALAPSALFGLLRETADAWP